jgi:hypothetical protein
MTLNLGDQLTNHYPGRHVPAAIHATNTQSKVSNISVQNYDNYTAKDPEYGRMPFLQKKILISNNERF